MIQTAARPYHPSGNMSPVSGRQLPIGNICILSEYTVKSKSNIYSGNNRTPSLRLLTDTSRVNVRLSVMPEAQPILTSAE